MIEDDHVISLSCFILEIITDPLKMFFEITMSHAVKVEMNSLIPELDLDSITPKSDKCE